MIIYTPSETGRSLGTGVRSVHENGRFREWEPMVAVAVQKKGASAPRHPRQRDVRRTSKQRGRLVLLPQAASLQKPTGLFADRLRP